MCSWKNSLDFDFFVCKIRGLDQRHLHASFIPTILLCMTDSAHGPEHTPQIDQENRKSTISSLERLASLNEIKYKKNLE